MAGQSVESGLSQVGATDGTGGCGGREEEPEQPPQAEWEKPMFCKKPVQLKLAHFWPNKPCRQSGSGNIHNRATLGTNTVPNSTLNSWYSEIISSLPCFSIFNPGRPFGLAVFEDRLWISDQEQQQLRSVHKRTGKTLQLIRSNMVQPASVVVVHPLAKPGTQERHGEVSQPENRFKIQCDW